jgi:hypothetical protein
LKLNDGVKLVIVFDTQAVFNICCCCHFYDLMRFEKICCAKIKKNRKNSVKS